MILRSQLRMNKNIVFPFISCIMIMFTLLVLIHKSADELNTVKKELARCKQQYDSAFTQLQSAIDLKFRLEKSLEGEKSDNKQKVEELQKLLDQEKDERRKDKDEAGSNYDSLNERFNVIQTENKENNDQLEKSNKKILELQEELSSIKSTIKELNVENEHKDKTINELREKLKTAENGSASLKKPTQSEDPAQAGNERLKVAPVQNSIKGPSTPQINPAAVGHFDELPKQVPLPPNDERENGIEKDMREALNILGKVEEIKPPQENVVKPPFEVNNDDKNKENVGNEVDANGANDKNQPNMFIPMPYNVEQKINKPVSNANDKAIESRNVLPLPVQLAPNEKEKEKVIPKQMKDYPDDDDNHLGEDGVEMEDYNEPKMKNNMQA